ncbi:hypothetical protein BBOV_III002570 [Babesia bovis T2Bo]|uniref:Uncharacterized protein n=1 Tax=Babesia bovis TaxID=5865 RepID=A7AMN8_BABBO|nr:hypothetical protein BBOV_III002570 [Babesia bovis T2Bo]EDO07822.1 hypothetical protein BBOV_III002570 [Babesia bovis T2Bo]|eukprot:XP_001611390.1 hypothetical protein [Babesia bovis T2Bo]
MALHQSLLEPPANLRQALDWITSIKKSNGTFPLAAAVFKFLIHGGKGTTKCKTGNNLELPLDEEDQEKLVVSTPGCWDSFLACIRVKKEKQTTTMGNEVFGAHFARTIEGLARYLVKITHSGLYKSTYSSQATWASDCAKDPNKCVAIFVAIARPIYATIDSIRQQCTNGTRSEWSKVDTRGDKHIGDSYVKNGFDIDQMCPQSTCRDVEKVRQSFWGDFDVIKSLIKKHSKAKPAFKAADIDEVSDEILMWSAVAAAALNI